MNDSLDCFTLSRWIAIAASIAAISCTGVVGDDGSGSSVSGPRKPGVSTGSGSGELGTMPVHHLTGAEYDSTMRDLVGTTQHPADFFPSSAAQDFDVNVGVLSGVSQVLVQGYYDAAKTLAAEAFTNATQKAKILTCQPTSDTDTACARSIIQSFGLRAWRRPLDADETDRYVKKYTEARTTLQMNNEDAMQHVVRILLTSPNFTLRIELDPDLSATAPRALDGYEVASRLSYLLWSSLPDQALFDAAAGDKLATADALSQQVDRMLNDPKSSGFFQNFFGQWLGIRQLASHFADPAQFPAWNTGMRDAMIAQANAYFAEFTTGDRPWSEFFSAPHTPEPELASIYASDPSGVRQGFLTLPAFLTLSSHPERTSPTSRAKTLIVSLLCTDISPPANINIPDLSAAGGSSVDIQNVRKKLEAHRADPFCASCHNTLDPIGLSMENFDPVGEYRTKYPNGDPIDATGTYQGTTFQDLTTLLPVLEKDDRLPGCPPQKLFTYALRRTPSDSDRTAIQGIAQSWNSGTLGDLTKRIVASDSFRNRTARGP